jgi:hypothetical protein
MTPWLKKRFIQDIEYLETLFPLWPPSGILVKLLVEQGYDNYKSIIGDPMKENTLIVQDNEGNILLFFKHSKKTPKTNVFKGITTMTIFNYTEKCIINKKHEITEVPFHLEQFIFEDSHYVTTLVGAQATNRAAVAEPASNVNSQLTSLTLNDNFFSINYNKGGMISLKGVRRHPEWKQEYEQLVKTKYVHICKSCESKAYAGCCSDYSAVNRKKVKMVLGWSG